MVGITALAAALVALAWLPLVVGLLRQGQWIPGALLAIFPVVLLAPWYPRKLSALLAPVAIYASLPVLAAGFFAAYLGRSIEWKGRKVGAVS
jgi:hypothetical protein